MRGIYTPQKKAVNPPGRRGIYTPLDPALVALAEKAVRLWSPATYIPESGEVEIVCPSCGHISERGVGRLCFNTKRGRGQCFACEETFGVLSFIKAARLNGRIHRPARPRAAGKAPEGPGRPLAGPETVERPLGRGNGEAPALSGLYAPLAGDCSVQAKKALTFLSTRGFPLDLVERYGLGLGAVDRLLGRLILPLHEGGALVYYQARSIFPGVEPKYLNPSRADGLRGKSEVVGFLDDVKEGGPVVIAEGLFSAIGAAQMLGVPAVAILGKKPSTDQVCKILQKRPSRVILMLDPDVSEAQLDSAARAFATWGVEVRVMHLTPEGGDPWDLFCTQKE